MASVLFGITAALCWGIHDVCVRFASARAGIALAFLAVLGAGLVGLFPVVVLYGSPGALTSDSIAFAAIAGAAYAAAGYALYRAFDIGPVRLVAPVIGSYPALSVLWAALQGNAPTFGQILATAAIILGVALVATLAHRGETAPPAGRMPALGWSLAAMVGFAATFAIGQRASLAGDPLSTAFVSRAVAFCCLLAFALSRRDDLSLSGKPWALLAVMGLCDATALTLVQSAGTLPRPEFAAVTSSTFGVITILLAWVFLKERLSIAQLGAVGVVFAGVGYLAL